MRGAARYEMEYLRATRGRNRDDANLALELGRRLDALRRYDQLFGDADWRPRTRDATGEPRPKEPAGER
jgi:hypothetical protein